MKKWFIVGGAGMIGSHFVDHLLNENKQVAIYDNFSSGREWHYEHHIQDLRFEVIRGDVENTQQLAQSMREYDVVIHLASNPDISKAITQPDIDFWQGTALTNSVLEAMRIAGVNRLLYASGSGVYGDIGEEEAREDRGELLPISTYGASKLAGEALINSYCHMFGLTACAFRFGNVVGGRQTHGVGLDFTKRLLQNSGHLEILGDGKQSKSYIHISDIINAVLLANEKNTKPFQVFNVATGDYITVQTIAKIIIDLLELKNVQFSFTGGDRGWRGDVPIVRLATDHIKALGWQCLKTSAQAMQQSITEMLDDIKQGRM